LSEDRLEVLLAQLREVATEIASFIEGRSRSELETDLLRERAVGMSLVILAELTSKIETTSPDFAEEHPDVPWAKIRGFRNHLAHNYFGLERDVLWDTVILSVPALIAALENDPPHGAA